MMVLLQFHFPEVFDLKTGPGSPCCGKLGQHVKVSIVSMESLFCTCHLSARPHSFVGFRKKKLEHLATGKALTQNYCQLLTADCNLILIYKLTRQKSTTNLHWTKSDTVWFRHLSWKLILNVRLRNRYR